MERNKAPEIDYQGAPALLEDPDHGSSRAPSAWIAVTGRQKRKVSSAEATQSKKARTSEETEPPRHTGGEDTRPKRKASLQATAQKKKKSRTSEVPVPSTEADITARAEKRKLGGDGDERLSPTDVALVRFQDRYVQQQRLGEGGCGTVFAGYRKRDNLQVAIKHIPHDKVYCKYMTRQGRVVSMEVAVMLRLSATKKTSLGAFAPIALLDWFELDDELILVLERPIPADNLLEYRHKNGGCLEEKEAKIIMTQLVGAALYLQENSVFHRDIKLENILIQTNRTVPIIRLIDFGLSCFVKKRSAYSSFCGTAEHAPPEWYQHSLYRAGPSTAWQMGVVLYEILHNRSVFETMGFLESEMGIYSQLSGGCKDFLNKCLTPDPSHRATLQELMRHPWLQ